VTEPAADAPPSCSSASRSADEPLEGTTTQAVTWLLLEWPGAWGRDAVVDTDLPDDVVRAVEGFAGRVLLVRRPDRRGEQRIAFRAETTDAVGTLTRHTLPPDAVDEGLREGEPVEGPLVLVCAHGRRDPCCARLGGPVYDALGGHLPAASLWQSSHQGGHRFAANVLALPAGVQLGRIAPADAARVAALLVAGRIPLDHYRGRTAYPARVQAAEIEVRRRLGIDRVDGLSLAGLDDGEVTFAHESGEVAVFVEERPGPAVPPSCGAAPEPTVRYLVAF
jgi:hypothetical protein